jgi:hypothetical protein
MWLEVRFLAHAYRENSIRRGEPTLCAPQVPQQRLVIANDKLLKLKKFVWEGRIHLVCPIGSPTEISHHRLNLISNL